LRRGNNSYPKEVKKPRKRLFHYASPFPTAPFTLVQLPVSPDMKAYTLIELMVTIAIIGILSAVVLASLNSARTKANDAAVKHQISDMRAAAELIFATNGNYDTVCDPGTAPGMLFRSAVGAGNDSMGVAYCIPDTTTYYTSSPNIPHAEVLTRSKASALPGKWAASVYLYTGGYLCADYLGNATTTASLTIGPTDADCN
jgi:prepilin-type N-terminal cleavage/methylation domain-containing protein